MLAKGPGNNERMAYYDGLFNLLGLRGWCDAEAKTGSMSMAELLAKAKGTNVETPWWEFLFRRSIISTRRAMASLAPSI